MAWLNDQSRPEPSPVETSLSQTAGSRPPAGQILPGLAVIPFLQVACIGMALALVLLAPPLFGALAWLLGAVAVPALWALFFVGFKQRNVHLDRRLNEDKKRRLNHALLLIGLAVGIAGALLFATEVAK